MASDNHGAKVNDPKIVTPSRARKIAAAVRAKDLFWSTEIGVFVVNVLASGPLPVPYSCANRMSFHSASGTLAIIVVANVIVPAAVISSL